MQLFFDEMKDGWKDCIGIGINIDLACRFPLFCFSTFQREVRWRVEFTDVA